MNDSEKCYAVHWVTNRHNDLLYHTIAGMVWCDGEFTAIKRLLGGKLGEKLTISDMEDWRFGRFLYVCRSGRRRLRFMVHRVHGPQLLVYLREDDHTDPVISRINLPISMKELILYYDLRMRAMSDCALFVRLPMEGDWEDVYNSTSFASNDAPEVVVKGKRYPRWLPVLSGRIIRAEPYGPGVRMWEKRRSARSTSRR